MAFVNQGGDPQDDKTSNLYKEIGDTLQMGKIPNIFKATGTDLDITRWFWDGVKTILLRDSDIPRTLKESIAVIVSDANSCKYCVDAHNNILESLGFSRKQLDDLRGPRQSFSKKEQAALQYAAKINYTAHNTTIQDHDTLRDAGYTNKQIIEITTIVALFRYANTIADALGVPSE